MPLINVLRRGMKLPRIGTLRKGEQVPVIDKETKKPKLDKKGEAVMRPVERPYWVIHTDTSDDEGTLEKIYAAYGTKEIKTLNVYLLYPDAEKNFNAWMEAYTSGQLVARSDERVVTYLSDTTNGQTLIQDGRMIDAPKNPKSAAGQLVADLQPGEELPYTEGMIVALSSGSENAISFKAVGRLSVVVRELRRPDRWFSVITGSYWYDIPFIYTAIDKINEISRYSGRPANTIPLLLKRVPVETTFTDDSGKKRRTEMHCIQLDVRDDVISGLMEAYEDTPFVFQLTAPPQLPEMVGGREVQSSYNGESFDEPDEIINEEWEADIADLQDGELPVQQLDKWQGSQKPESKTSTDTFSPEALRQKIAGFVDHHKKMGTQVPSNASKILASQLDKVLGNSTDRYVVTAYLLEKADGSSKTMQAAEVQAFLDWLGVKGFGDMPKASSVADAKAALEFVNKERGQLEF